MSTEIETLRAHRGRLEKHIDALREKHAHMQRTARRILADADLAEAELRHVSEQIQKLR
jgi:hypothetical protein